MDRRRRAARTVALMSLFTMADTQTDVPIASFVGDGSDLISLIVGIEPIQAGSGDPSPDNVRPISGWAECKVYVSPTNDPDDATVYTIDLDGTRYGGTLDVTAGKLTVDRAIATKNNFEYGGVSSAGLPYFNYFPTNYKMNADTAISTHYKYLDGDSAWSSTVPCFSENLQRIRLYNDTNTLPDNLEVVYELATPIVYDLTPTQVTTLIGTNNIWADTGDIKYIEYNI